MKKIFSVFFQMSVFLLLSGAVAYAHLCDNVFRQADKLIVKPENYNLVVKDGATFKIFLQNNMDRGIAEISLIAESPAFVFNITPGKMRIPKNQRVFFSVTLWPKPGVKTGSYPIHFRLVGGGRQFKTFSLNMKSGRAETDPIRETDIANILIVKSTPHSLQLDGKLEEKLWKNSAVVSNFSSLSGGKAVFQTVVLLTFNKDKLYFGVYCADNDSQALSEDDTIEIQIAKEPSGSPYYSVTIPGKGQPSFKKILDSGNVVPWPAHNIECASGKDKEHWMAEVSIPFTSLGSKSPTSSAGEKWYMRIIRIKVSGKPETSYWAADASGYNKKEGFGELILIP